MAVSISKPAINLREKLSGLERDEGLVGLQLMAADTAAEAVEALNLEDHTFETFTSTGIDDNATSTKLTVEDSGATITGDLTVDTNTLYVDSTNNRVGIGTSSPQGPLDVDGSIYYDGRLLPSSAASNGSASAPTIPVGFDYDTGFFRADFNTIGITTGGSERMRITNSGNLLVGKTASAVGSAGGQIRDNGLGVFEADGGDCLFLNRLTSNGDIVDFRKDTTQVGSISVTASATSYNTSSDERLKENIADAQPASDLIDGIRVREFDWKADGEHQRYGMIAQELETVAPEAVTKGETEDDMWSVDYSKLVPMLVKEIQDLRKRVAELENTQ